MIHGSGILDIATHWTVSTHNSHRPDYLFKNEVSTHSALRSVLNKNNIRSRSSYVLLTVLLKLSFSDLIRLKSIFVTMQTFFYVFPGISRSTTPARFTRFRASIDNNKCPIIHGKPTLLLTAVSKRPTSEQSFPRFPFVLIRPVPSQADHICS